MRIHGYNSINRLINAEDQISVKKNNQNNFSSLFHPTVITEMLVIPVTLVTLTIRRTSTEQRKVIALQVNIFPRE